jgi:hypothetical protein
MKDCLNEKSPSFIFGFLNLGLEIPVSRQLRLLKEQINFVNSNR